MALYQPMLHSIALKMVGSLHDAEDIVQETFLKWLTIEKEKIINTKAYLIRSVTNNCINHLEALKRKKDQCLDSLNPTELLDWSKVADFSHFDLEQEVSNALGTLHKKLEPLEKGIFLLREVFNFEYDELQHIFDKKKENCRQLFCRAKNKLASNTTPALPELSSPGQLLNTFKRACDWGHLSDLVHEISQDIAAKLKKT
ncbi:sigma-70 family RNA polymerase sigma factor [Fulvivirga sp. M361]|uniref:sigma-70 family RNA polymerase sigma factor n=1 Tax=Fulvivirga sp. M361 TaxID=2594266 RepID=UPI002101DB8C|nr:sigma-70 family RNA polymerase sigma factor [Fulvivirga sp. M361]